MWSRDKKALSIKTESESGRNPVLDSVAGAMETAAAAAPDRGDERLRWKEKEQERQRQKSKRKKEERFTFLAAMTAGRRRVVGRR